ncbi:hypothetical protein KKC47_03345 [Patescibacteria group bacterium]|nr:hypothetical protein [Patescibacteria group bacterium]
MLMLLLLVSGSLILYRLNDLGSSKKKRYSQAIIGGLLLGVAILVTPKAIFWLAAFFVGWVVTSIIESRQQFYFILPLMLISGLVVCSTIIFNLFYESWFYDLDKYYNAIWLANKQCPAVWNTRHNLLMALLVIIHWGVVTPIIFVLSGVILSLSKVIQNVRKSSGHIMIWLLAIAGVVLMLMAKTGNLYNLYPLLWVFIAFTSLALEKIFNSESISAFLNERILLICLIILFGFGTNISSLTLSYSLQPLQTVLALAKPGDTYITERGGGGGGGYSPVFMFDADPLYFMSSVDPDPNRKDLFEVVDTKKPKFVFSSSMNKKTNQQLLTDYFEMSSNQKEYLSPYFQFFILK